MRRELAVVGSTTLEVAIPEGRTEMEAGWQLLPPGSYAMLFELHDYAPFVPLWVPVKIEGDTPLDVLWIQEGRIEALCTLQRGCVQGYGDTVIELPAHFCEEKGIKVGDLVIRRANALELGC